MYIPQDTNETVLARTRDGDWMAGEWTGESGWADEHFVIDLYRGDEVRCHYEDIREA